MITHVAIRWDDRVYSQPKPYRHWNVLAFMHNDGINDFGNETQGFLTDEGYFLDRYDAAQHALKCGQVKKLQVPPRLYSEDLW